jgi:hypothetical protein
MANNIKEGEKYSVVEAAVGYLLGGREPVRLTDFSSLEGNISEPIRLDWSSGAVFEGIEAVISEELFEVGENIKLDDEWQGRTYRLLPLKKEFRRKGEDLVVSHNSELKVMVIGFSQSVSSEIRKDVVSQLNQGFGEAPVYNEEALIAPTSESLVHLVAWGVESNFPKVADNFKSIFPLIYPNNFR